MKPDMLRPILCGILSLVLIGGTAVHGQTLKERYPTMAPLAQYMMDQSAEIALARSAAPKSISEGAEVLLLGSGGFDVGVKGANGWTCLVERSWNAAVDFPEFWNPKIRAPICFNPAAVRSVLPVAIVWAKMVLAGQSQAQMASQAKAAFDAKKMPALEPGAMGFMMSKDGYLTDDHPHFHPHVMFFEPLGEGPQWGANLPGSPIFAGDDNVNRMSILPVPVPRWSDGTQDSEPAN
ncbi:MAG TPA: hypothetical protein VGG14_16330 [Candidatus Sulfotelmatobacter sp.]|jgi:hypothetical protein